MLLLKLLNLLCLVISCLCSENDNFKLAIPIYFDISKHLKFLIPRTQKLLNDDLSQREFDIEYQTKLIWGPGPSYTIKLDYGEEESYFISPYGKTITIYQTDFLIAANKVHEFIARVIEDCLLKIELDFFDSGVIVPHDNVGIDIGPNHIIDIHIISSRQYNWDKALFDEVFQPVINELYDLIELDVKVNHVNEIYKPVLHLDDFNSILNHEKLTFLIYLSDDEMIISGIDSSQIIIPKKGAIQLVHLNEDLDEMEQIEILEVLTGQLFKLLGMNFQEPKSPFIRIDFMIRKQIHINYLKLKSSEKTHIQKLMNEAKWGDALRLSWDFLRLT
ncbi:putative secreted protein [Wickerhamomyces ciferrii]|uniref:Secreted protein n=1 Tax=Wickerhamomyces ciferrii (strain ATCC 14091 / BCRC 22168 / CBS 111 / JCM 3599 / NBRC 0793 / NRRL Y-1031 F-60-10) TaxID=1206466 RepID=K0KZC8_WICCF|nr:uncharacterized protein BN7_6081 [Wickerhamomyces ciferrii]CCH46488.1 putative secreted protein [Wickerhamomyces ciferrii]